MVVLDRQPLVHPGHGEVHRDLQGLVRVQHLAHLPDGEGEVEVHLHVIVIEQERGLLFVIICGKTPGKLLG